jgi:flagellar biosynthesis protein FlhG
MDKAEQKQTGNTIFLSHAAKSGRIGNVISIASGKGGVGKTLTTVNLAVALQRMGQKVLILDGDLGLANVDVVLGLASRYTIYDVLNEKVTIRDIILDGPMGLKIIPSGSGITSLVNLSYLQRVQLVETISKLDENFDFMIIDTGAGISAPVLHLNSMADKIIVVTTPEPHATLDAYAFIKVMQEEHKIGAFDLLVNMTRSQEEGTEVGRKIAEVADRYLGARVNVIGSVPHDSQVRKYTMARQAASEHSTFTVAGQAWNNIAREIVETTGSGATSQRDFWQNLVRFKKSARVNENSQTL